MARRLGRLASDSASVALLLLMTASAVFHSDQQEVVALVQESTGPRCTHSPFLSVRDRGTTLSTAGV